MIVEGIGHAATREYERNRASEITTFSDAHDALLALDAPREWSQRYDVLPRHYYDVVSPHSIHADRWLENHPIEAATAKADRAQQRILAWRQAAAVAPTVEEKRVCLQMAIDAADDLQDQLQRLSRAEAA